MRASLQRCIARRRHHHGEDRRRSEAGDTLIELLIAIAIIGLSVSAILGGLAAALGSSGTHRSLTNLDAILRSYADVARYDIQLRPFNQGGPLFLPCAAASAYLVVSAPYPSSGPPGTAITVFGSGFTGPTGSQTATVTDHLSSISTVAATIQVGATGNFTATFVLPAGLNSGPATIKITDGSNVAFTASSFDIDPSAPVGSTSLAGYQVGLTAIRYWNGTAFQPTCDTSSPDNQLQELTVSGTAPGASDQLNIIVADSNYVFPPPQVVNTFIGQNGAPGAGYGYLADGANYTIYADVIEPAGLPGIKSVTANVGGITTGQTAIVLSPVPGGTTAAPNGQPYNYSSSGLSLTAGSPGDGTTVAYTVNAMDMAGLPSQYSGNGTVTFDTAAPTGSVSVNGVTGGYASAPLTVSFTPADAGSGVDLSTGQLVEFSAPLVNGSCQGSLGNPSLIAVLDSPVTDPMTTSGNCYQYQYTVSDNVGNRSNTFTSGVVKIDTAPPSVSLQLSNPTNASVSPSPPSVTFGALAPGGARFTLTVNATDPVWSGSNLSYRFSRPPGGWNATPGGPATWIYTSTTGANGGTVRVTVTNGVGLSTTKSFTLVADTARPSGSVTVTNPTTNGYVTSSPLQVNFSATDDGYGLYSVGGQLFQLSAPLSGGNCQGSFGNPVQVGTTGLTSPYQDTSVTFGNCYEYQYVVADTMGNQATITSNPVMFDLPSVAMTYPVDGTTYTTASGQSNTWTGTITGTVTDTASTVSNVVVAVEDTTTRMWWDGSAFDLPTQQNAPASGTSSWTYALPGTALAEGDQYRVVAQATDAAGLQGSATAGFTG